MGRPFSVFPMKQFSENIPGSILEATRVDGAGEAQTFLQIVLPWWLRVLAFGHPYLYLLVE